MDSGGMIPLFFCMMDGIRTEYKSNSKQSFLSFLCFFFVLGLMDCVCDFFCRFILYVGMVC